VWTPGWIVFRARELKEVEVLALLSKTGTTREGYA
jgi:hypothetical protein